MALLDGSIRVLIADDHPTFRGGLSVIISREPDMEVVGEAVDGADCIARFCELLPDVTLMDLQMPHVDGLQAIAAIHSRYPAANIIVLTTYPGDARVARAIHLGATSYLLKSATSDDIVSAIRGAIAGDPMITPEVAAEVSAYNPSSHLTMRELSVLRLVAKGASNKEIARFLHLSEATVKARMQSILQRLEATDRTHAVTTAMRRGFLD